MSQLKIRIVAERGLALDLDGRLTASNAGRLLRIVEKIFAGDEPPPLHLALDVAELAFVDAEGLAVLVRTADLAREAGTSLVLREPTRHVVKMLKLAGLVDLVRSDPSVAAGARR